MMETQPNQSCSQHLHHQQVFFSVSTCSALLVDSWTTGTFTGLLLGAVCGAVLSLCLEGVKSYRITHILAFLLFKSPASRLSRLQRLLTSVLHALDISMGYILMLLIMTFNIYIITSVIVGAGLGHFFLRPLFLHRVRARLQRRQRVLSILAPLNQAKICDDCGNGDDDENVDAVTEDSNTQNKSEEEKKSERQPYDLVTQCRQFSLKGKETSV